MTGQSNIARKLFGDRRDKSKALRDAGFTDEAEAAQWAASLNPQPIHDVSEVALTKKIRDARPDLTLATATYIARQTKTRYH